jgi:hypothetical protein
MALLGLAGLQHQRLPTLHSSMLGLEISLGMDSTISFEDYLNGMLLLAVG